jgi:hypothetical protein
MVTYYYLHGKCFDGDMFEGTETRDRTEISQKFKEKILEKVDINPELAKISQKGLPSPKYRASVLKYLYIFFKTGNWPSPNIIDYSDFHGKKRPFPPREPDEEMDTEYERFLGFHETYRNDWRDITEYDCNLGFVFAVNERGFHLEMLGESMDTVSFYFKGKNGFRAFAFNPVRREYDPNPRGSWHMRIQLSDVKQLTMLTGSYPVVLLLSSLLKATKKKPINFDAYEMEKLEIDKSDLCLAWELREGLHDKINNERFVLPKKTKFDDATLEGYIARLIYFGYDVKTVTTEIKDYDYKGHPIGRKIKEYYIPPFICKRDANLIIQSIENSHISEDQKRELFHKFISESGCHRYSKDDLEESELPTPSKKEWKDNDYALIIYTVLRSYANPLPVISNTKDIAKKKENLQDLIIKHYGSPNQRAAITNNLNSMIAVGLPIKKEGTKYVFDMSGTLTAEDLNLIQGCIMQNDALDGNTKARLIDKFREIFYSSLV